jgi:hypothetical protein
MPAPATPGRLSWAYRGELEEMPLEPGTARRIAAAISRLAEAEDGLGLELFFEDSGIGEGDPAFARLRDAGLVVV